MQQEECQGGNWGHLSQCALAGVQACSPPPAVWASPFSRHRHHRQTLHFAHVDLFLLPPNLLKSSQLQTSRLTIFSLLTFFIVLLNDLKQNYPENPSSSAPL